MRFGRVLAVACALGLPLAVLSPAAASAATAPHLRFVGYWASNLVTPDATTTRNGVAIAQQDSNLLPLYGDDASFRSYAANAVSSSLRLNIITPLNPWYTCAPTQISPGTIEGLDDAAFRRSVVQVFSTTRRFLNGAYTNGVPMWSRTSVIQLADEPNQPTCKTPDARLDWLVHMGRRYFGTIPLMIDYIFPVAPMSDTVWSEHVPTDLDIVAVDPYYFPGYLGKSFLDQVTPRLIAAEAAGKPVFLLARSFADTIYPQTATGTCGSPPTTLFPLLSAADEANYYLLAQFDPHVVGLLWAYVFNDVTYRGDDHNCVYSRSGVLHSADVRAAHASEGAAIVAANAAYPLPTYGPRARVERDFNGDGTSDLLLYNRASGSTARVLFASSGMPSTERDWTWTAGFSMTAGDFNGDGISDVFLYNRTTGAAVRELFGTDGMPTAEVWFAWPPGMTLAAGDYNGDGISDLLVYNATAGGALDVTFDFWGNPVGMQAWPWSPGYTATSGDFNGDGIDDVLLYNPQTGSTAREQFGVTGRPVSERVWSWSPGFSIAAGDFTADGVSDLVLYNSTSGRAVGELFAASGVPALELPWTWAPGSTVVSGNFDGAGVDDLLQYNPQTGATTRAIRFAFGIPLFEASWGWTPGFDIVASSR